ncbi:hypothetical protein BG005_010817 [Podila minutissima]|nr:hypothetical protein BG005_010817 [Podila minutissima]
MYSSTSSFPPSEDLNFILHVQEGIYGNILVKESNDWAQRNITVHTSSGSRLPNLLDTVAIDVRLNSLARTAEIFVHLGTNDPEEKKKLLDDNCFRTNIEILYPRSSSSSSSSPSSSTGSGRLEVKVTYGEIALDFGKPLSRKPAAIFESLGLATMKGDVSLRNVGVLQRTRIRTERGSVKGTLLTPSAVDISTCDGRIDLKVHSTALQGGHGQHPSYLDLMLASKSGSVDLQLSPSFNGHFDLTSASSTPTISALNWVHYTTNQTTKITGWVSDNGWEPPYMLPRIDLYSGSGAVSATIRRIFG